MKRTWIADANGNYSSSERYNGRSIVVPRRLITSVRGVGPLRAVSSPPGHDAIAHGNVLPGQAGPRTGSRAMKFDGSSGSVSVPSAASLNVGTGPFTVGVWVKLTSATETGPQLIGRSDAAFAGPLWDLYAGPAGSPGVIAFDITPDGYTNFYSAATVATFNDGKWHLAMASIDRVNPVQFTVDGAIALMTDRSSTNLVGAGWNLNNAQPLLLGADLAGDFLPGSLAGAFLLAGTALSIDEIRELAFAPTAEAFRRAVLQHSGAVLWMMDDEGPLALRSQNDGPRAYPTPTVVSDYNGPWPDGTAMKFNGTDAVAIVPNSADINVAAGPWTAGIWYNTEVGGYMMMKGDPDVDPCWAFYSTADRRLGIQITPDGGATSLVWESLPQSPGWHRAEAVVDRVNPIQGFIDGELVAPNTLTGSLNTSAAGWDLSNSAPLSFGADSIDGVSFEFYTGSLAAGSLVAGTAISQADAAEIAAATTRAECIAAVMKHSGAVLFMMDEGTFSITIDTERGDVLEGAGKARSDMKTELELTGTSVIKPRDVVTLTVSGADPGQVGTVELALDEA